MKVQVEETKVKEETKVQVKETKVEEETKVQGEKTKVEEETKVQVKDIKVEEETKVQVEKTKVEEETKVKVEEKKEEIMKPEFTNRLELILMKKFVPTVGDISLVERNVCSLLFLTSFLQYFILWLTF
jgi:hypothetical protein